MQEFIIKPESFIISSSADNGRGLILRAMTKMPMLYTAENHVVLFTYKQINGRVTHNEMLSKVEMRNSSFLQ